MMTKTPSFSGEPHLAPLDDRAGRDEMIAYAQRNRRTFLGFPIDVLTMEETLDVIRKSIRERRLLQHVVVNVAKLVQMRGDPALARDVTDSDLINIDGMGVVYGCRLVGITVAERVAGIELMEALLAECEKEGWRPFFLGAREDVLEEAVERIRQRHPRLVVAGAHHGYFPTADDARVARLIAESRADCLFIAISSPRKEAFMNRWRDELNVPFVMGVGGSIDVIAGKVARAPRWMQRIGLEWGYRLAQEPRRMWRRYLFTNAAYARILAAELLARRRSGRSR
jgi:N-acetylglucosaminyldiphosphoundecaprenol N-acetyl-beta-D-mannosaminyltransferase